MQSLILRFLCVLSVSTTFSAYAENEGASDRLKALLNPLVTLKASFRQQIFSSDDYLIQDSAGEMHMEKPGKIRWIVAPPMEQWLISNGETLWLYDPDLEQVIIKPFEHSVSNTPAMLLNGGADQLDENYTVSYKSLGEISEYTLKPKATEGLYESIKLTFNGSLPADIIIYDSLGQRTEIKLTEVDVNTPMSPEKTAALYHFNPPSGVDVLGPDTIPPVN